MSYIGNNLQVAYPSYTNIDDISGSFDSVTTSFALTVGGVAPVPAPLSSNQCMISVGGVIQRPDDTGTEGFRLSGGNIVFSSAPNTGEDFFGVILAGADYVNVGVNYPSGSASTPSITFDTDLDTGLYNPAANELGITTAGTSRLVVDSSGNVNIDSNTLYVDAVNNRVGVGTTSPGHLIDLSAGANLNLGIDQLAHDSFTNEGIGLTFSSSDADSDLMAVGVVDTNKLGIFGREGILFGVGGATIYSATTERVRIDDAGRLLVGTSTDVSGGIAGEIFQVISSAGGGINLGRNDSTVTVDELLGVVNFYSYGGSSWQKSASIKCEADAAQGDNDKPGRLVFSTTADGASSPTERMRISNNGTHSFFCTATTAGIMATSASAGTSTVTFACRHSASSTTTGTDAMYVYSNGNLVNTYNSYGPLNSDERLKQDIIDIDSQWDDIKGVRLTKFHYKNDPTGELQLGPIAQELEKVSPGLITRRPASEDEIADPSNSLVDGDEVLSFKASILYMKAVGALQEAMTRIETLEASNTDLLARVSALESA